jgi:hypothetical protein
MRTCITAGKLAVPALAIFLLYSMTVQPAWAADKTMTGKVSDAMCGAKHMMAGNEASCTHECVKNGSKYALVVGDKVYTLDTTDKSALDQLSELAGKSAKVTGELKNDTITVKAVAAGS